MSVLKDMKALLEGLQIAGKHLGRHAVTVQYPEQKDKIPEGSRGMVILLSDQETGELNCTACMLCARSCPTGAIIIDAPRNEQKKRELKQFQLDHTLCCFCGLCEEACNFSAIKLATNYEWSVYDRSELEWDIKKLQEWGKDVAYTDTRRRKNPAPKIGPAAETFAANTTVAIEKAKEEKEKAARAAEEAAKPAEPKSPDSDNQKEEGNS